MVWLHSLEQLPYVVARRVGPRLLRTPDSASVLHCHTLCASIVAPPLLHVSLIRHTPNVQGRISRRKWSLRSHHYSLRLKRMPSYPLLSRCHRYRHMIIYMFPNIPISLRQCHHSAHSIDSRAPDAHVDFDVRAPTVPNTAQTAPEKTMLSPRSSTSNLDSAKVKAPGVWHHPAMPRRIAEKDVPPASMRTFVRLISPASAELIALIHGTGPPRVHLAGTQHLRASLPTLLAFHPLEDPWPYLSCAVEVHAAVGSLAGAEENAMDVARIAAPVRAILVGMWTKWVIRSRRLCLLVVQ